MDTGRPRQCSDQDGNARKINWPPRKAAKAKDGNNQGFFGVAAGVEAVAGGRAAAGLFAGAVAPEVLGAGAAEGFAVL